MWHHPSAPRRSPRAPRWRWPPPHHRRPPHQHRSPVSRNTVTAQHQHQGRGRGSCGEQGCPGAGPASWMDLGLLDELGDDDGLLLGHGHSIVQELLQITIRVGHVHGSTAQHVGGAHDTGVPHLAAEVLGRLGERWHPQRTCRGLVPPRAAPSPSLAPHLHVRELLPEGLADANGVKQAGELEAVLG